MALQPSDITPTTCFRVAPVPMTGLSDDSSYPLRVYVLRCTGGKFYIGIHPKQKIQQRIAQHFTARRTDGASQFCVENPPQSVVCVWPAIDHSVEAAMFFAMMGALDTSDFRRIGGWVFTSARPSPLAVMQLEQCRRQLAKKCFDCGADHYAGHSSCKGPNQDCWYKCVGCGTRNNISARGQSNLSGTSASMVAKVAESAPPGHSSALSAPRAETTRAVATARKRPPPLALDFESLWIQVRKKPRTGRKEELGSVVDLVNRMETKKAKAAQKHVNERIGPWSRRYNFGSPQHYEEGLVEFRSKGGGGSGGVGVTKDFGAAIFKELCQR